MNRVLCILLLLAPGTTIAETLDERCKQIGDLAHVVMVARQSGVALATMMSEADSEENLREITLEAYGVKRYKSYEYQEQAAEDFRDKWTLACYTSEG